MDRRARRGAIAVALALAAWPACARADLAFGPAVDVPTGVEATAMAALPAGPAGVPAVAVVSGAPARSLVLVRLGADGAAAGGATVVLPAGSVPSALAAADLDGDGRPEIIVASAGTDAVSVFRPAPDLGSLVESGSYAAGPNPRALAVADLTGDGRPDVAVATDAGIALLPGDGAGGLGPAQIAVPLASLAGIDLMGAPAPADHLVALASADLDRDGRQDLVALAAVPPALYSWRAIMQTPEGGLAVGPAHGGTVPAPDLLLEGGLALGDLNGDGNVDVAATNTDIAIPPLPFGSPSPVPQTDLYAGAGDGTFAPESTAPYVVHHLRVGVAAGAADLDRDGRAELLVADLAEQKLVIHRDALGADALLAVPMPAPTRLASALDVNGDGAPDLVLGRGAAPGTIAVALARPVAAGGAPDLGAHELGAPDTAVDVAVEDRGVAPLAVSGVALSGAAPGDFAITADACSDTTVPGGGRCRLRVRFHPTAVGARSAQIVISDARGEVLRLALAGTGLASTAVRVGCASRPNDHRRRLRCAVVLGPGPAPGRLALRLVRGGHAWARAEVRTGGRLVLRAPRPLARGRYTLVASVVATDGRSGETRRDVTVV